MKSAASIADRALFILLTISLFAATIRSADFSRRQPKAEDDDKLSLDEDLELSPNERCELVETKPNRSSSVQLRIAGGNDIKPGEFPSFVSVKSQMSLLEASMCSGVLVSDRLVLTAAHCVAGKQAMKVEVAPGIWIPRVWSYKGVVPIRVDKICPSKSFSVDWFGQASNDFAILRLERRMQFNSEISAACLPDKPLAYGQTGHTIGAGNAAGWFSGEKVKALPTVRVRCRLFGFPSAHTSRYCFSSSTNWGQTCIGDSGGPTLVNVDGKQCVYGLTSYGRINQCTNSRYQVWASANIRDRLTEVRSLMSECLS